MNEKWSQPLILMGYLNCQVVQHQINLLPISISASVFIAKVKKIQEWEVHSEKKMGGKMTKINRQIRRNA